jgi:aromatic-amino-acid transaminase
MHGGQLVAAVLGSAELRAQWEGELAGMRERIKSMRQKLAEQIHSRTGKDWSFVQRQKGLFCYSGLSREQVLRLRKDYSIYTIETGRICVAALNSKNVDYVAGAIASVIG